MYWVFRIAHSLASSAGVASAPPESDDPSAAAPPLVAVTVPVIFRVWPVPAVSFLAAGAAPLLSGEASWTTMSDLETA